jgi:hypothetical protein
MFFEYAHYFKTQKTLDDNRSELPRKLSISSIDYSKAKEYFEKCDDDESKMILQNITNKTFISKKLLHKSLTHYCSPLSAQLDDLINILHDYHKLDEEHDGDNFIKLEQRSLVFRIPFFMSKMINMFNYYVTYHLKRRNLVPVDNNHNVYMRYDKNNTKTIVIFSGIVGGRLVLARMLKYIPTDYNIIGTVYEEISSKFYEDVVYDILVGYGLTDNVVVYSWSYGTLFANSFVTKHQHHVNIKLKIFCDIFGLPLNTLYMANICGTDDFFEAYRLIRLKVRPFWNGVMMLLLLKSEFIEKRIMTLTLNDYLMWSYDNLNTSNTLLFISNDDIMYNVETVKRHCSKATIMCFPGGHCSGVNRKSLLLMKQKLLEL